MAAILLLAPCLSPAARLSPVANRAFDNYVAGVEARLARQHARADTYMGVRLGAANGAVQIEPVNGGSWPVKGGLLHHWRAVAVVPGASAQDLLALLRDYNRLDRYYAPEVVSSHVLADNGEAATVAMRFRKHIVITVVLDAEFQTQSALDGNGRGYSYSRSTHIWEVDAPGTPRERRRPEGNDDGFLWRLNSYWSFEETPQGLLMECEAVSLTRDVPTGLGWLIRPIIETLPRESLEFTFTATRNALMANAERRHNDGRAS